MSSLIGQDVHLKRVKNSLWIELKILGKAVAGDWAEMWALALELFSGKR